jgi:Zn-dependent peptidase ImmA (M78 family)
MTNIRRVVKKVIANYGTDVYEILSKLNIRVLEADLPERIPEVFFGDYVVLKSDLPQAKKVFYLAHAMGHYFLHKEGNYFVLFCDKPREGSMKKRLMSLLGGWCFL